MDKSSGRKFEESNRFFLFPGPRAALTGESHEDSVIEARRKIGGRESHLRGAFTLRTEESAIGEWLKGEQGLDATGPDHSTRTVPDVAIGVAEIDRRTRSEVRRC